MPLQMTSLAEKLKAGGYETHYVGKWDAGHSTSCYTPYKRGYDTFLGFFGHTIDPHARRSHKRGATGRGEPETLFLRLSCHGGSPRLPAHPCLPVPTATTSAHTFAPRWTYLHWVPLQCKGVKEGDAAWAGCDQLGSAYSSWLKSPRLSFLGPVSHHGC